MQNKYKKTNSSNSKGFTLVEVLVAMTVFVIASIMFMGVFNLISQTTLRSENERFTQQDARYAIELMSREVRESWNFAIEQEGKVLTYENDNGEFKIHEGYNSEGLKTIYRQQTDCIPGCTAFPIITTIVGLGDEADDGLSFRVIEPGSSYPSVEIRMKLVRSEFERFATPLTLLTRVTSRMRGEELKIRYGE